MNIKFNTIFKHDTLYITHFSRRDQNNYKNTIAFHSLFVSFHFSFPKAAQIF